MNTKSHSFRLTVHDSGRVRWCIGNKMQWQIILKKLVFLPAILLSLFIVYLFVVHHIHRNHDILSKDARTAAFRNISQTNELDYDFFNGLETSYVTDDTDHFEKRPERTKRESNQEEYMNEDETLEMDVQLRGAAVLNPSSDSHHSFWGQNLPPSEIRKMQASLMRTYMDTTKNPCEDFYQYACGNWANINPIPPDRSGFDTFELLRRRLDYVLKDLLEDKVSGDEHIPVHFTNDKGTNEKDKRHIENLRLDLIDHDKNMDVILKAKYLYKSCSDAETIRKRGALPLIELLDIFGGWPVLNPDWNEEEFDIIQLMAKLRLYNNDILVSEWIGPDIKNSDEYIIQLDQSTLGLPTREYFLDKTNQRYLEAYRLYMTTIAILLGAPTANATEDAINIVEFEIELAKIISPPEFRNVSLIYKRVTIRDLQIHIPQIDWLRYLETVMERHMATTEPIVCFCWTYLIDLVELLTRAPPRTVTNYLLWRFIKHRVNNLDDRFEEAKQRFYRVLFGREKSPARWQSCVSQVNSNLGMALGRMFVEKYFDQTSKNDTITMTRSLQESFKELLSNTDWLGEDTKHLAFLKVYAMSLRIGYPNFILDKKELSERYKDISVHPNYYFENTLSILQHLTRVESRRLGTLVNKVLWNTAPAVVNAYYSRNKNQIMFPAGILQPPFYHQHFPKCLNYGGIGVVIGHEITHGFDDKGRLFDRDGNLQKWWTPKAIIEFHQRAQCLIDQYNGYIVPEINVQVDGMTTQGENIADNGGIKQSYRAYMRWLDKHPHANETLPNFNITNKQLFFLNFAQVWCGSSRPEAAKNKLKIAVHSPGRFRVIGALSNSKDFAHAYNCPSGSPMNPIKKCSVW